MNPRTYRASRASTGATASLPSGLDALDARLPGGLWPRGTLIEILSDDGKAASDLVQAILQTLLERGRRVVLIDPPRNLCQPDAETPARSRGQWVTIQPEHAASHWSAAQCLRAGGCDALVAWLPDAGYAELRSLQDSARSTHALCFVITRKAAREQSSPAPLRVLFDPVQTNACVTLLKCNLVMAQASTRFASCPDFLLNRSIDPSFRETLINHGFRRSREGGPRRQEAGANIPMADDPMGEPQERRVNPVTFLQPVEGQRHWIPDIALRFRDDEQNQSFLRPIPGCGSYAPRIPPPPQ
ncbi:MAG: hypothetical protein E6Q99_06455 [Elusimicrobia bacterium]|nr:MAG: hypothetical protein E6Q99_06455 [Elusimicrobiota bacterium]